MPKRVDHEERRARIAEALWRIACARGLDGASLRDVAAEAGISLGQLQHYFASKDDMLVFALEHISDLAARRVGERLRGLSGEPSPRDVLLGSVREMLPLDDKSRTGHLVQIAYFVRAVHDERLRRHAKEGVPGLRAFFAGQVREGQARGEVAADRDPEVEAALLIALVDGLASYAVLEVWSAEEALGLVAGHLDRLFGVR
ncbi:TetR/AcrR family transcriptional regulator [Streptomyces albireticuli]|uniref:TetR/AcrR family transcriptional regulator n=1 Tax=Streptomyces albireticuli TaxID=1940 RepID=UPI001E516E08|nr:TetR/AcrR family transcriptional regulator [Streptomyces albireticuli]MCD9141653.1 TetR family transcriptional regulator [Streptomyces albireticuli]MCD9164096.1 TetR family transcriptional regulator [Streptomyces albireticuli]MCD9189827.1 TetR family transcriptional regulator [Streptomyces albireticuli]